MGTRSMTIILDGDKEMCRFYRQYDGYPEGHGMDLAKLANVTLVNGIGPGCKEGTHANGMGCLAAQIIASLKKGIGNVYMDIPGTEIVNWVKYIYTVRDLNGKVQMQCTTQTGEYPFNLQAAEKAIFTGTPAQFMKKFKPKKKAA